MHCSRVIYVKLDRSAHSLQPFHFSTKVPLALFQLVQLIHMLMVLFIVFLQPLFASLQLFFAFRFATLIVSFCCCWTLLCTLCSCTRFLVMFKCCIHCVSKFLKIPKEFSLSFCALFQYCLLFAVQNSIFLPKQFILLTRSSLQAKFHYC